MKASDRFIKTVMILMIVALAASSVTPLHEATDSAASLSTYDFRSGRSVTAATNLVVTNLTQNHDFQFDDDDFYFRVRNYTVPVAGANVILRFKDNGTLYAANITNGEGWTRFYDVPQGVYTWNVTWSGYWKAGVMRSNGPEVAVTLRTGNLDLMNNNDDLEATVLDIDGKPAAGLNFTVHYFVNGSIYVQQIIPSDGIVKIFNIPIGVYIWKVNLETGPYAGMILKNGTFISDGTARLVHHTIGPFTGSTDYYDLEVFVYYETSFDSIPNANVTVTYKNGTVIDSKLTPNNGTVRFVDLPVAFINWSVTLGASLLGRYYYDLTAVSADIRKPEVMGPGDQSFLVGTANIVLTWQVYDEHPKRLEAFVDSVSKKTVTWTNQTEFTLNMTGYAIGVYDVKLVATDLNLNTAEDRIKVRIYENVTPIVVGPGNISIYYTETGKTLRWNVTEDNPHKYVVYRNGTQFASGTVDPTRMHVTISLDGLQIGIHLFSLKVNDTSNNVAVHNVTVTVRIDDIPPTIVYEPSTVFYSRGDLSVVRNWTVVDNFKSRYVIRVDGVTVVQAAWTSEKIQFDFSGMAEGVHYVELTVYDLGNNTATSTVMVVVSPPAIMMVTVYAVGISALFAITVMGMNYLGKRFRR
ncbi:MAG: hypothetical protein QXQ81_05950 [Candidatus Thorarchaeota archaeon]